MIKATNVYDDDTKKFDYKDWWENTKKTKPVVAKVDATVVGLSTGAAGAACLGNSIAHFIKGDQGIVFPLLQLITGICLIGASNNAFFEVNEIRKRIVEEEYDEDDETKEN